MITPNNQPEPTWEIVGDAPLSDEAIEVLAELLLDMAESQET